MIGSTDEPARPVGELTGRHVLILLVMFFATILAVNGWFIYAALSTYSGVVANEPYRKGLAYNERIAADERQTALGWSAALDAEKSGKLALVMTDRGGRPLTGLQVRAAIGRPSTDRFDLTVRFIEVAPGRYEARDTTLAAGNWIVALEARTRSGDANPDFRLRRKLWLAP